MTVSFEKVIPTQVQIDELFFLLKNRKYYISHKSTPSKKDHFDQQHITACHVTSRHSITTIWILNASDSTPQDQSMSSYDGKGC